MSPRAHFYVAAVLLTAAFTPLGMSLLSDKHRESTETLASYREALGKVTSAKEVRSKRSGTSVLVTYEFTAGSEAIYSGRGTISLDEWRQNRGSQPVKVYFDPDTPARSTLARSIDDFADERPLSLRVSVGFLIGAPLALVFAAVWSWFVARRHRLRMATL
jgi:hypothetical protein